MTATVIRTLVAAILFGAWLYLIVAGRTDVASFIDFVKLTLAGLAAHIVTKGEKSP